MQLLQRWFRTFEQPIVSAAQQTAMLAALNTHNGTAAVSVSADDASRDVDVKQAAGSGDLMQPDLPAAAIGHLSMMQKTLIARIVKCIVAVTEEDQGGSSRLALMQWLVKALTKPHQLETNSAPSMEQQALLSVLEHYASSGSSTVQTLDATPLQPALNGMIETAVVTENKASSSDDQAGMCQPAPYARVDTDMSVAADSAQCDTIAAHLPGTTDAAVKESEVFSKPDAEVEHSFGDGCMWLHKRVANMGISHTFR